MIVLSNTCRFYLQYYEFIILKTNYGVEQIILDTKSHKEKKFIKLIEIFFGPKVLSQTKMYYSVKNKIRMSY